jgi:hypothetical protein
MVMKLILFARELTWNTSPTIAGASVSGGANMADASVLAAMRLAKDDARAAQTEKQAAASEVHRYTHRTPNLFAIGTHSREVTPYASSGEPMRYGASPIGD